MKHEATVDIEEISTTKSEKLLAVVLAVFLLVGGLWTYDKLDEWARATVEPQIAAADRAAVDRLSAAEDRAARASAAERVALDAVAASARIADEEQQASEREGLLAFGLRFAFVAALLASGFWLLARLRRAGSRWFPIAFSVVGFSTVLAFVMAGDYLTDYVDPLDLGPLILSLLGIVLTLAGFAALQRYLARRIPSRRVRKSECPFCGYPVGEGEHCEGCGREVVGPCARCSSPRRIGTLHCRACGAA